MGIEAWIVLAVLAAIIAALAMTRIAPDAILLTTLKMVESLVLPS